MAFTNDAVDDQGAPQPDKQPYFQQLYPPPDYSRTTVDGRPLVPPQPQQQPKPEPYIPSRTDRPYSQWGDPDFALAGARKYPGLSPGPFMPQINDFPALIHAAVMGLGRFGSRYTGMPAIAMGTYATAYWNAYSQGLKERAAQSYQQYRQARQMTIDRGKDEMLAFRQVYAAYHDDKGNVTDPIAFSQALLATAKRFQNHSIINAVENGQIAMAERILQATDGQLNNLIKAQHQEERQKQLDEERRQQQRQLEEERRLRIEELKAKQRAREQENIERQKLGLPPISGIEDGGGASIASTIPDTTSATSATPDTDTTDTPPDETTEPVQTASRDDIASDVSEEAPVTRGPETTGMAPTRLAQAQGQPQQGAQDPYQMPDANPTIDSWAKERIMGRSPKVPKFRDNAAEDAVSGRQAEYNKMLDKIEQDPGLNTREKINAALERAGLNEMRRQLDQYLDGKLTMSGRDKAKEPWSYLQRLGSKIGSDVTAETPEIRAAAMKAYARGGKQSQTLLALGTATWHLDQFENEMGPNGRDIPPSYAQFPGQTRYIGRVVPEALRKKAARLNAEAQVTLDETNKALVGGVGADRGRKAVEALGAWATTDEASVAQNVQTLHEELRKRIIEMRNEFISTTGGKTSDFTKMFDRMAGDSDDEIIAKAQLRALDQATQGETLQKPGAPAQGEPRPPPAVGTIKDGWRFKGGNPADRNSWEKQ
jgi:hypothetical protein